MSVCDSDYALQGYGISGFRCFSGKAARVGPFGKVHVITGRNNCGKSTLTDVAVRILPRVPHDLHPNGKESSPLTRSDVPQRWYGHEDGQTTLSLCFSKKALLESDAARSLQTQRSKDALRKMLEHPKVTRGDSDVCWFDFTIEKTSRHTIYRAWLSFCKGQITEDVIGFEELSDLGTEMLGSLAGGYDDCVGQIILKMIRWIEIPQAIKIKAFRTATSEDGDASDLRITGPEGLINKLLRLSNPKPEMQYESGRKWNQFVRFVRDILDDPNAKVRIDADATMIQVRTDGAGYLALSDLGTGIEELVILAAVVSCNQNTLMVIEEPEIHLHPTLQAKIVKNLLEDENNNRFIITTHSPTIINSAGVSITRVEKIGGVSYAHKVSNALEIREALEDMGARPSDLLQANYIVWVEGPSDRIYVNYWLSVAAPELREGIHYSVMIYGGRLLNSCSADAPDTENSQKATDDLIKLFSINTHFCILMDSDKRDEDSPISKTKERIVNECGKSGNMSWVTQGRTVENYVPEDVLREAIREVHGGKTYSQQLDDPFIGPLDGNFDNMSQSSRPDKIRVARAVVRRGYDLGSVLDLRRRVEELARDIRKVNGRLNAGGNAD